MNSIILNNWRFITEQGSTREWIFILNWSNGSWWILRCYIIGNNPALAFNQMTFTSLWKPTVGKFHPDVLNSYYWVRVHGPSWHNCIILSHLSDHSSKFEFTTQWFELQIYQNEYNIWSKRQVNYYCSK